MGEGKGFDSLRRLQSNYNAKFAPQGPNIYYEILVWSPDMGPRFGNKIEELEELVEKYRIITGKVRSSIFDEHYLEDRDFVE